MAEGPQPPPERGGGLGEAKSAAHSIPATEAPLARCWRRSVTEADPTCRKSAFTARAPCPAASGGARRGGHMVHPFSETNETA